MHSRTDVHARGLLPEAVAAIIDRDVDWRAVRDHHAATANAARVAAYRDRLAASLDPLGEPDVLARRQLVGLRVLAEMRRREQVLRLRRRLHAVPSAQVDAPPMPSNVVRIGRGQRA